MKMIFYVFVLIILCLPSWPQESNIDSYIKPNDGLKTLEEFKDTPEMISAKLKEVENINRYRSEHNKKLVSLDILASRVANMQCYNAAVNGYIGHWDLNGYKPYIRYSLAGGKDHVMENAFGENGYGIETPGMDDAGQALNYMKKGLEEFMSEGPGGGHYENVINGYHNYVGIGYYSTNINGTTQIRYYEEFIDRYIEWDDFPLTAAAGETAVISGRVLARDAGVYAIIVYYENFPGKMTPSEISSRTSYPDFTDSEYKQIWPWDINFDKETQRFKVKINFKKPGFYYIQVFLKKGIASIPYNRQASVTTRGLANASGVVMQVR